MVRSKVDHHAYPLYGQYAVWALARNGLRPPGDQRPDDRQRPVYARPSLQYLPLLTDPDSCARADPVL